jgi:integrase
MASRSDNACLKVTTFFHSTSRLQSEFFLKFLSYTLGRRITSLGLGWHTFRHAYCSLLDETDAPVDIQHKLMRHPNVATIMNVYGISTLRAKQDANSKAVQMLLHPKSENRAGASVSP